MALEASGCDQAHVVDKPRLLSDNGASYIYGAGGLHQGQRHEPCSRRAVSSANSGQYREMASDVEKQNCVEELLLT